MSVAGAVFALALIAADPQVQPADNGFAAGLQEGHQHSLTSEPKTQPILAKPGVTRIRYEWRNPCASAVNDPGNPQPTCPQNPCPDGQEFYRLWQVAPGPAVPLRLVCSGDPAAPQAAAAPQVTDAMVLNAFRRVPLPSLVSHSQPEDKTLINFDTIFYTDAQPLTRHVTLLGQDVRLEITPSKFEWVHGDGTVLATTTAGAPYPSKQVTHRYARAHTTVLHRVVVTWSAQWSLNGGPLQPVVGTVTTTGPATPLRVAEASPALSGYGH